VKTIPELSSGASQKLSLARISIGSFDDISMGGTKSARKWDYSSVSVRMQRCKYIAIDNTFVHKYDAEKAER
jgi:hypothetical protein